MDLLLMRKQLWYVCWSPFSNTSTASLKECILLESEKHVRKLINNSLIMNTLVWRRWQPDWSSSEGWPQVTWKVTDERIKKNKVVHHSVNVVVASFVTDLRRPKDAPSPADRQEHGDSHQVHQQEIPQHWLQRKHCKLDRARSSNTLGRHAH